MRGEPDAKAAKPTSEVRTWVAVLGGAGAMTAFAAANAIAEGLEPSQFVPGLAGGALAGLIAWAGLRVVRRRDDDVWVCIVFLIPIMDAARLQRGFSRVFFDGLRAALVLCLVLWALSPLMTKRYRFFSSEPSSRDAAPDGATRAGGVADRAGRG